MVLFRKRERIQSLTVFAHLKWGFRVYNIFDMQTENVQQVMHLQVTDGLAVAVIQNPNFEFIMPTKDVALGYGISGGTIRDHQSKNPNEFINYQNKTFNNLKLWNLF